MPHQNVVVYFPIHDAIRFYYYHLFLRLKWHPHHNTSCCIPNNRLVYLSDFCQTNNSLFCQTVKTGSSGHNTLYRSLCPFANFGRFTFCFLVMVFLLLFCQQVLPHPVYNTQFLETLLHHLSLSCWSCHTVLVRSFFRILRCLICLSKFFFFLARFGSGVNWWHYCGLKCTLQCLNCISHPWLCGCNSNQHQKGPLF